MPSRRFDCLRRTVTTVLEEVLDVRFVTTPLKGCRGRGAEESMMKTTDELLVVYSVYKRENDRVVDGATIG